MNNIATVQEMALTTVHVIVATTLLPTIFLVLVSVHFFIMYLRSLSQLHGIADINECLIQNFNGCSRNRSQCNNTIGGFVCVCNPGFVSDGENSCLGKKFIEVCCYYINYYRLYRATYIFVGIIYVNNIITYVTDVNECETTTACDVNADCTNTVGNFTCVCHDSYFGNGKSCDRKLLS